MAPSALPAPTIVCSSSMNRIIEPSCFESSLSTPFRRSSNSPLNFAPAIREPISNDRIFFPFRPSGTSPLTILWARPSTMAVLPTPDSPMRTGLFLVRRCNTWMVRLISASRPMTGSSSPFSARSVTSTQYFERACQASSAPASSTDSPPRKLAMAFSRACGETPDEFSNFPTAPLSFMATSRTVSLEIKLSPCCCANLSA